MNNIQFFKGVIDASGCISNGWNLIKPNYWLYFGISLVALLIPVVLSCIPFVGVLIVGPLGAVLMGGVYYVFLREMRGEPVEFGMMFKGFEKAGPLLLVGLINAIPSIIFQGLQWALDLGRIIAEVTGIGRRINLYQQSDNTGIALAGGMIVLTIVLFLAFFIFSIAWTITFAFAVPLLIEHDIGPMDAITLSARAGWSNAGGMVVLMVLQFLIALAGVFALCIGILFVIPVLYAGWAFAYRRVFPMAGPMTQTVPPPPDAYGGTYGRGM